jgi:hypothetical protein
VSPSHLEVSHAMPMSLELVAYSMGGSTWTNSLDCPNCHVPLNLHQPDEEQPSQLLGTCGCCSRWFFLVESELDRDGTLLFELPSAETLRTMFGATSSIH